MHELRSINLTLLNVEEIFHVPLLAFPPSRAPSSGPAAFSAGM
jgi:hypothetical protein